MRDKDVLGSRIPVPPLDEQRRIVDLLEDHLSRLDAAVAGLAASEARLGGLRDQVVLGALLGLGSSMATSGSSLASAGVDDGVLRPLPTGWRWARLGDLADVVGGVTKDAKRQSDPSFVEVPYLRVANVQRGRLDISVITTIRVPPAKARDLRLEPGDVLLNEGGDRDKLGRGWVWNGQVPDCIHQNHVFRARVRDGALHPKLLSWAANTVGGRWCERNGKQSVNLASISLTKIRLMPIPVPPAELQPGIAERIESALAGCDHLEAGLRHGRLAAQGLRRSLLHAAFTDQLSGSAHTQEIEELAGV